MVVNFISIFKRSNDSLDEYMVVKTHIKHLKDLLIKLIPFLFQLVTLASHFWISHPFTLLSTPLVMFPMVVSSLSKKNNTNSLIKRNLFRPLMYVLQ